MEKKLSIPVSIKERNGIRRVREPVSIGIPFPKGAIRDPSSLIVSTGNKEPIAFATQILGKWSDGSLKWILTDLQISMSPLEEKTVDIKSNLETNQNKGWEWDLDIEDTGREFIVRTGKAEFHVDRATLGPLKQVILENSSIIDLDQSRLVLTGDKGDRREAYVDRSFVESFNSLKGTLYFDGHFSSIKAKRMYDLQFKCRVTFWASHSYASVEVTLLNPDAAKHPGGLWDLGDPGSRFFKELGLELIIGGNDSHSVKYCAAPGDKIKESESILIYQDSSGGESWKSRNHVNHLGRVPLSFRGYRTYQGEELIDEGLRATPIISISNGKVGVTGNLRNFWQNFPSSLEAKRNHLKFGIFPGSFRDLFELQGGEQKTRKIWLDFNPGDGEPSSLAWVHYPLVPHVLTEWYCQAGVFPYLIPESKIPKQFPFMEAYEIMQNAVNGESTFFDRREIIDEYGWRNFGDLYADHENELYQGEKPVISHYNNQYDLINSFLKEFVRTGEEGWFRLAEELACHVSDIDIYHTEKDRYEYNNGLFWHTDHYTDAATSTHRSFSEKTKILKGLKDYGGGPSYAHVYSRGLLNYYYMTGDVRAKEAVLDLARFVMNGINGPNEPMGLFRAAVKENRSWIKQKRSVQNPICYGLLEGPGRDSGNALGVLLDAYTLTGEKKYLFEAEELIRHCIHPRDDLSKRKLSDVNARWMYTIFLQALGKYLEIKYEVLEMDYMYFYAKGSLLHYAKWMLENEVPFLSIREQLDYPNFATRAATDTRKAHVLMLAAFYSGGGLKEEFIKKAQFFFENSIRDLLSLETRTLTRPLAILMQNIDLPLYSAAYSEEKSHSVNTSYPDFGLPKNTESLRYLLKENVKLFGRLISCVTSRRGEVEST
jgi:hypothetical protein